MNTRLGVRAQALNENIQALTYRSRAVRPLVEPELRELENKAQARNHAEGLTGFAMYEQGRFFQWLEGPAASLARVWDSVRRDSRHTDIEAVSILPSPSRLFASWDMKLTIRGPDEAPPQIPAPSLYSALDSVLPEQAVAQWKKVGAPVPLLSLVPLLVEAVVLPKLPSRLGTVTPFLPRISPAAPRLARLLLADDPKPAVALLRKLYARAGSLAPLCATVIEPAARGLGDMWSTDDCSQVAMTLALSRLQSAARQLTRDAAQADIGLPAVLVAPQPGEQHMLGASLDADLLWQAGWDTHREFPASDGALQSLVGDTWFDVLDLSLSPSMRREESLPLMAATIAGARLASLNPSLTVVVGGRAFFEQTEGSANVGADASTSSALQVVLSVTRALEKTTQQADQERRGPRSARYGTGG